jgi:hypothetical protein
MPVGAQDKEGFFDAAKMVPMFQYSAALRHFHTLLQNRENKCSE